MARLQERVRALLASLPRSRPRSPSAAPTGRSSPLRRPAESAIAVGRGPIVMAYAPDPDGDPDPGEIVWTWVPYEDDPDRGKDRPVLLVARLGRTLVGLMLSSQDHDDDPADWYALGSGGWDPEGRPSWVRLDRIIDVNPAGVRREGASLDRRRFDLVAARLRSMHGWT